MLPLKIRLDDEMYAWFRAEALALRCSMSHIVRRLVMSAWAGGLTVTPLGATTIEQWSRDTKGRVYSQGCRHERWTSEGGTRSHGGYMRTRVGMTHPLASQTGYCLMHHLVWVSAGRPIPSGDEVLHHINGDINDNRLENLELLTRAEHNKIHNIQALRDGTPRAEYSWCDPYRDTADSREDPSRP